MSLVIKEIIVKTTVEQEPAAEPAGVFTPEMMERLKEEILSEIARYEYNNEPKRRER